MSSIIWSCELRTAVQSATGVTKHTPCFRKITIQTYASFLGKIFILIFQDPSKQDPHLGPPRSQDSPFFSLKMTIMKTNRLFTLTAAALLTAIVLNASSTSGTPAPAPDTNTLLSNVVETARVIACGTTPKPMINGALRGYDEVRGNSSPTDNQASPSAVENIWKPLEWWLEKLVQRLSQCPLLMHVVLALRRQLVCRLYRRIYFLPSHLTGDSYFVCLATPGSPVVHARSILIKISFLVQYRVAIQHTLIFLMSV